MNRRSDRREEVSDRDELISQSVLTCESMRAASRNPQILDVTTLRSAMGTIVIKTAIDQELDNPEVCRNVIGTEPSS